MRISTSRVNRGRPSKDAAIPPMIRPETSSDFSQSITAPRVVSGGRVGGFLATVDSAELCPSFPDFFRSVSVRFSPTEILSPCQQCVQLLELARNRRSPQLLSFFDVDSVPPLLKSSSFCLSDLFFHMSNPLFTTFINRPLSLRLVHMTTTITPLKTANRRYKLALPTKFHSMNHN